MFGSLAREMKIRWKTSPHVGLLDAVVAFVVVGWLVRPCDSVRIRLAGIATSACALFVPHSLGGLVGRVTWTFLIKAVKEAGVHGFHAALHSERFVKACLYVTFGAVWIAAVILGMVAWELMWRDDVFTYQVVASLELPAVLAVLLVGCYSFPERARAMRVRVELASIALARFVHDTVYDEIQRSNAGEDAVFGAEAPVGAGGLWDPRYSAVARHWGQVVWHILSKVLKQAWLSSFNAAKDSDFLLNVWMYGTTCAAMIPRAVKTLDEVLRPLPPDDAVFVNMIAFYLLIVVILVLLVIHERVHSACCNVRSALFAAVCFIYEKFIEGAGEAYEEWKAQGKAHKD